MYRNILKFSFVLTLLFIFLFPAFGILSAQQNEIVTGTGITTDCVQKGAGPNGTDIYGNCGFFELFLAVKKVVNYAVTFALSFSVVIIAYAGWIYLTSGGSPSERAKANKMFISVAWGIALVLGAWLIVNLIVTALVNPNEITNFIKN